MQYLFRRVVYPLFFWRVVFHLLWGFTDCIRGDSPRITSIQTCFSLRVIGIFLHLAAHIFFQNAFKVEVTGNTCHSYNFRCLLSGRSLPLQYFAEV